VIRVSLLEGAAEAAEEPAYRTQLAAALTAAGLPHGSIEITDVLAEDVPNAPGLEGWQPTTEIVALIETDAAPAAVKDALAAAGLCVVEASREEAPACR
jgi:hypothetical protein